MRSLNFYPRSPCGERPLPNKIDKDTAGISIHALLAESDKSKNCPVPVHERFLSTLSLRRATCRSCHRAADPRDFYPRSPCGERPSQVPTWLGIPNFYPRSPCGERLQAESSTLRSLNFYPRSPCGERPLFLRCVPMMRRYFYPRSPCGERQRKSGTSSR